MHLTSGVFGYFSSELIGVRIDDFGCSFLGGIGIEGELGGPDAVFWLKFLLFWLVEETILCSTIVVCR